MKTVIAALVLGVEITCLAQNPAQNGLAPIPVDPPQPPVSNLAATTTSLSFEVKTVRSGGSANPNPTQTASGYTSKTTQSRESSPTLELKVRNLSKNPGSARFEWYFVANPIQRGANYVWDRGGREIAVAGGGEETQTIDSRPLVQNTTYRTTRTQVTSATSGSVIGYESNTTKQQTGARPAGWIVRMLVGDKLIKVQASSAALEQIGRDPAQMQTLLGQR